MSENGFVTEETQAKRRLPAWALGLIIAAALFVVGIFIFQALGFGDNPVLGETAATIRAL